MTISPAVGRRPKSVTKKGEVGSADSRWDALLPHLPLLEKIVTGLARKHGLQDEEAEDFSSWVKIRLVDRDAAILRKFRGESKFSTFLTAVVTNQFLDYRISQRGKWRPSAAARRLGTVAVQLEQLVYFQGIPFEQAAEMLRRNHGVEQSTAELARLLGQLPHRTPRRFEGEETLERIGSSEETDRRAEDAERSEQAAQVLAAVNEALDSLSRDERMLLKMWSEGHSVATISRVLRVEQKPLYRRRDAALSLLRETLDARGIRWDQVEEALAARGLELSFDFGPPGQDEPASPSNRDEEGEA